jgi:choline/glycine/proline betaine transport protein
VGRPVRVPLLGVLHINPGVFFPAAAVILLFLAFGAFFTEGTGRAFEGLQAFIVDRFGWFYVTAVAFFLLFVVILFFSRFAKIRLGPDGSDPDYSYASWFAMLFSAGMGIGLVFFSVAEPILHFQDPPGMAGGTRAAAVEAMRLTFFHWGLHAWAVYIVVALSLAYFSFRKGLPMAIRSAFHPLLGDRIYGPAGDIIDTLAVFGTLFGVATSLGLGVMQVNAGLASLMGIEISTRVQISLIAGITAVATVSVVLGLDRGIRILSNVNMTAALFLVGLVFFAGPTIFLLNAWVQNTGVYLQTLVRTSFWMDAWGGGEWQGDWTLFYWGWWIAWSPFVGMFIARISRGRTIREFIAGVLLVPAGLTTFWLTVFGNSALHREIFGEGGIAGEATEAMLFVLLQDLPLATLTSLLAVFVIIFFFVTSSDSGSLVIDMLASGGNPEPPVGQRIFWAVGEGVVAAVLLLTGGLAALQTAAITTGLPFALVLVLMAVSLWVALRREAASRSGPTSLSGVDRVRARVTS